MRSIHRIHGNDTVAVALKALHVGDVVTIGEQTIPVLEAIAPGHKIALTKMNMGDPVIKYNAPIGTATAPIAAGAWVHIHNVRTALTERAEYTYTPDLHALAPMKARTFDGFERAKGRPGVRNELWILPTVGCVNGIAQALAAQAQGFVQGGLEGVYAFPHPYGCSQMGEDERMTQRILCGLIRHPNAAGVLVLGLGCENNSIASMQKMLGTYDPQRVRFLICQDVDDEMAAGLAILAELATPAQAQKRVPCDVSGLLVGLKCGGSDGFSGLTANPLVGLFSDRLIACGGGALLTEVPEMFGAETLLMNRCVDKDIFDQAVAMIHGFKDYFTRYGQVVYENPSPGNKAGGITTLEDKSLGCTQKGGSAPVVAVLGYGEPAHGHGLSLLTGPGNDLIAATALAASGAQLVLFTTGRGTPFGSPVPTVKIASNTALWRRKGSWMDFDAGAMLTEDSSSIANIFFDTVLAHASGKPTQSEAHHCREIAIWKDGVTL